MMKKLSSIVAALLPALLLLAMNSALAGEISDVGTKAYWGSNDHAYQDVIGSSTYDISGATITMASNPFAAQTASGVALMSPAKRAYVVTSAVTYGCDRTTGKLTRYWNYTIVKDQPTSFSDGNSALLAENIRGCNFVYANLANQRSGLVGLTIDVGIAGQTSAKLTLEHQIHVDNTP